MMNYTTSHLRSFMTFLAIVFSLTSVQMEAMAQTVDVKPEALRDQHQSIEQELVEAKQALEEHRKDFQRIKDRLKEVGLSNAIGFLLRKKRTELPRLGDLEKSVILREQELEDLQLKRIKLEEIIRDLNKNESSNASKIEKRRQELSLISNHVRTLVDLDTVERETIKLIRAYSSYIDKHVLWIPSSAPIELEDAGDFIEALTWIIDRDHWQNVGAILYSDISTNLFQLLAVILAIGVVVVSQRLTRTRLEKVNRIVASNDSSPLRFSLEAFFYTLLRALPIPLVFLMLSWRLDTSPEALEFTKALSLGFEKAAYVLAILQILRLICEKEGFAEQHLRWSTSLSSLLRRHLLWFTLVFVPSIVLVTTLSSQSDESHTNSLGRLGFLVADISLLLILFRIIRFMQSHTLTKNTRKTYTRWLNKFGWILYLVCIGGTFALALLAVAGYFFTAQELFKVLIISLSLIAGLFVLNSFCEEWFTRSANRFALRSSRKKSGKAGKASDQERLSDVDQERLDFLDNQANTLRRTFIAVLTMFLLYHVWASLIPAFGFLDTLEFWSYTAENSEVIHVTLANILLALSFLVLTVIGVKTLPSFLETLILSHLDMDPPSKYATTAILRYLLIIIGTVFMFRAVEVEWGHVQWLAAALTVGLGFGLQEIFANFVSGLIILFERPIRVGDTVTVGETSGEVIQLNMRSTMIRDWDEKELIIPNKLFITDKIINWSLSSHVLRIIIKVGIAYGSDIEKAESILKEIARKNEKVLKSPEPNVLFKQFGDSTLDFELRVYVAGIDHYLVVKHGLNSAINHAFKEADIEIAFPQRVLHFRKFEEPVPIENVTGPRKADN